jgi:hypothetical protein
MNERIKELAEQAGLSHMPSDYPDMADLYQGADFELEKFAELIVRECAKVSEDDITDGDACCTNTAYRIASQIKEPTRARCGFAANSM